MSHKQKFTLMQRKFFTEYAKSGDSRAAAKKAGYSPKYAASAGCRLLKKYPDQVVKMVKKAEKKEIATLEEVLGILTDFARGKKHEEVVVIEGVDRLAKIIKRHASPKDQIKAAELLAKKHGAFVDQIEVNDMREKELHNEILDRIKKRGVSRFDFDSEDDEE